MPRNTPQTPPKLDMNPLVDMAFLLVSFFMLTTTFKTDDPVTVELPNSHSEIRLPERNMAIISISEEGKIAFGLDGKKAKKKLIELMATKYDLEFSEEEQNAFSLLTGVGTSLDKLKDYLNLEPIERKKVELPGVPADSARNELQDWIVYARIVNPRLRFAVKGDGKARYPIVQKVIKTLVDNHVARFNLITELEREI